MDQVTPLKPVAIKIKCWVILQQVERDMKIDIQCSIGILGTILMSLSTWVLLSVVDLKEQTSNIQGELSQINQNFGRVYNYIIINELYF
jgi:hypothetical protein